MHWFFRHLRQKEHLTVEKKNIHIQRTAMRRSWFAAKKKEKVPTNIRMTVTGKNRFLSVQRPNPTDISTQTTATQKNRSWPAQMQIPTTYIMTSTDATQSRENSSVAKKKERMPITTQKSATRPRENSSADRKRTMDISTQTTAIRKNLSAAKKNTNTSLPATPTRTQM